MLELPANIIDSGEYFTLLSSCSNSRISFSHARTSGRSLYFFSGEHDNRTTKRRNKIWRMVIFIGFLPKSSINCEIFKILFPGGSSFLVWID
jgi:hypothetical protein